MVSGAFKMELNTKYGSLNFKNESKTIIFVAFKKFNNYTMKKLLLWFLVPLLALSLTTVNAQVLLETFDTNAIPAGWTASANSGSVADLWTPGQLGSAGYDAGTAPEHTGNGGYYLWVDFSDINPGDTSDLVTPVVDVSTLTSPFVYFWLFSSYTGTGTVTYNDFNVYAWNGASWDLLTTISGENGGWTEYAINLSANTFGANSVQIRFSAVTGPGGTGDFNNDFLLDDISFDEAVSCPAPINLGTSNILANSADLYWTENGIATSWEIEYGTSGFSQGSGTTMLVANDTFNLSGLTPISSTSFFVRAICGPGDTSNWAGPFSFTTPCAAFTLPYFEDFENVPIGIRGDFGNCWVGVPEATNVFRWESENSSGANENSFATGPFFDHTLGNVAGGIYLYTEASSGASGDTAVLNSPLFDFSTATYPRLSFWYHRYGLSMGILTVEANNGSGWTEISTITGQQQTSGSEPWLEERINLFQYAGDTVQFRYIMEKPVALPGSFNFESDMSLDDVTIDEAAANDVGVNAFLTPGLNSCGLSNMPITLTVYNYGGANQFNVDVTVEVSGSFSGTYTSTIDTLLRDTEMEITVGTINTAAGGNIVLTGYTSLTGDGVLANDTLVLNTNIGSIPNAISMANQTTCSGESVSFMNTSALNARWYDDNDSVLFKGDMFTVSPTTTSNYEVEVYSSLPENVGETAPSTGGIIAPNLYYGITFEANSDFVLDSMVVYPNGSGTITVGLYDEVTDSFLTIITVPVSDGGTPYTAATVALDLEVPASPTRYRLLYISGLGVIDLGRNTGATTNFPYSTINNDVVLTNSSTSQTGAGTTTLYYYFYDWSVSLAACPSDRTPFTVNVGAASTDTIPVVGCDSAPVLGVNQTSSGFVVDTLLSSSGCDSLVVYDVNILRSTNSNFASTICMGESFTLADNSTVNAAGTYVVTLVNDAGCDSIITTVIDMFPMPNVSFDGLTPQICDTAGLIDVDLSPIGGTLSGNGISGTTFDPMVAGLGFTSITYQFVDSNACDVAATFDVEVIDCITGIKGISGIETINVYPNPYSNSLRLIFEDESSDELNIRLFDALGRNILSKQVETTIGTNTIELNILDHAPGVTFIQFERNGKTYQQSLLKK